MKNRKNFETTTRICGNFEVKTFFFFLVFTSKIVENRKNFETTTRICGNFETIFFLTSRAPIEFTTVNDRRTQLSGEHLGAINVLHCNHDLLNG